MNRPLSSPLLVVIAFAALTAASCTTFYDTGADVPADAGLDATDTDVSEDSSDVAADTGSDADAAPVVRNSCGGVGPLFAGDEFALPGDPCGPCEDGLRVCNGLTQLRCIRASAANACGGCTPLAYEPGESCGVCDDGYYACADGGLACVDASQPNVCGGCLTLRALPGEPCNDGTDDGLWSCDGTDALRCITDGTNDCGGDGPLYFDGAPARVGDACASTCGEGLLQCDEEGALACVGETESNACGGCGTLAGVPGSDCGQNCDGVWTCDAEDPGRVVCTEPDPNLCGGCTLLSIQPGTPCDADTFAVCAGLDAVVCSPDNLELNACGGTTDLGIAPGEPCGVCDSGTVVCLGPELAECVGDGGTSTRNICGGCALLTAPLSSPCGACGSGRWVCDGQDELRCEGDGGSDARNACGGCATLVSSPGDSCGGDGVWVCDGDSRVRCTGTVENGCGGTAALAGEPGDECGLCGLWTCASEEVAFCDDPGQGGPCDTGDAGICGIGLSTCDGCMPVVDARDEVCDGDDNDCDGEVDESVCTFTFDDATFDETTTEVSYTFEIGAIPQRAVIVMRHVGLDSADQVLLNGFIAGNVAPGDTDELELGLAPGLFDPGENTLGIRVLGEEPDGSGPDAHQLSGIELTVDP